MFAREWKAKCPQSKKEEFIAYLHETGVKETSSTPGFKGAQIFSRDYEDKTEITLISYWESLESIESFAGKNISKAKLYPEDYKYELEPDTAVQHYEVIENLWM